MLKIFDELMDYMKDIEYGFKSASGVNLVNDSKFWEEKFADFYYLQSPDETINKKCGVCWDQVEVERKFLEEHDVEFESYWIANYDYEKNELPSHTFIVASNGKEVFWFEHSWGKFRGVHKYKTLSSLLLDVKKKFVADNDIIEDKIVFRKYNKPKYHISCDEFYKYIDTQEIVRL